MNEGNVKIMILQGKRMQYGHVMDTDRFRHYTLYGLLAIAKEGKKLGKELLNIRV
jgi:hypothetical protein